MKAFIHGERKRRRGLVRISTMGEEEKERERIGEAFNYVGKGEEQERIGEIFDYEGRGNERIGEVFDHEGK